MYLLFLDESGNNDKARHFILGGIAVFEGLITPLRQGVDALMEEHFPDTPHTPFHASELYSLAVSPKAPQFTRSNYRTLVSGLTQLILHHATAYNAPGIVLFGQIIEKALVPDPYLEAFEGIVARFNQFLITRHHAQDPQKGLVVVATSAQKRHTSLRLNYRTYRVQGTRLGYIHNLPLIPLFAEADATRLLQLADLVAYALRRYYEHKDAYYIDPLWSAFFQKNGRYAGLYHRTAQYRTCTCPACLTRRPQY